METSCKVENIFYIVYFKDYGFYHKDQPNYSYKFTDKLNHAKRYKGIDYCNKFFSKYGGAYGERLIYKCEEKDGIIKIIDSGSIPKVERVIKYREKVSIDEDINNFINDNKKKRK